MKVQQSFVIDQPQERLWEFFEQVEEVALCVPGVESVEVLDEEHSKVRMTQAVGPMTATFDLKMKITERRPHELMEFTAVGRAVKGAAGNVRTVNKVMLVAVDEGTRVDLESEMAMGGVLGSVGQKVIAKQAAGITEQFSASLERAIKGEPEPAASAALSGPAPSAAVAAPAGGVLADPRVRAGVLAGLVALAALVLLRRRRT
jgi:carbon monoxide dehydrogenase subunit G